MADLLRVLLVALLAHRWHPFTVVLSANREATLTQSLSVCAEATVDEECVV